MTRPVLRLGLVAAGATLLAGCSSYGYDGYGTRVSVGYGGGYYGDGYYGSSYNRSPYYGWYDDFYYPGTGYYVWDRQGYRHTWSDTHRRYWSTRRGDGRYRDNWSGYGHQRRGDWRGHRRRR